MTRVWHKVNFKQILKGLDSGLSSSSTGWHTMVYYLPITRVLGLCEMQIVLSRILTWVAVSISYNPNHYTLNTSKKHCIYTWGGGEHR